jgi:hypothetical protein
MPETIGPVLVEAELLEQLAAKWEDTAAEFRYEIHGTNEQTPSYGWLQGNARSYRMCAEELRALIASKKGP